MGPNPQLQLPRPRPRVFATASGRREFRGIFEGACARGAHGLKKKTFPNVILACRAPPPSRGGSHTRPRPPAGGRPTGEPLVDFGLGPSPRVRAKLAPRREALALNPMAKRRPGRADAARLQVGKSEQDWRHGVLAKFQRGHSNYMHCHCVSGGLISENKPTRFAAQAVCRSGEAI